jgi:acetolactate synthase-1/2/3 large subunit
VPASPAKPVPVTKAQTGAEALIRCLEREGVEYVFGLSGGAAMPIFDALVDSKIKLILVRHEQGATHMADGYARSTGKPGVVLVTSGPGATNTVTGLLTALMDSCPMIVLTGQTISPMLGKDAFQEADVTGITYPVVKHSYMVREANDFPRIVREAFHIATSGRPGPVLIDVPKDVSQGPGEDRVVTALDLPGYRVPKRGAAADIERAAQLIMRARRPVLYVGHGAVISGAGKEVMKLAEKLRSPIVNTLLGKGAADETHPLHLGMLGMHGTAYANKAVTHCDLIVAIGARWDDRITGKVDEFCIGATKIHIDVDPTEFNKILRPDVCILGDAKAVLEDLLPRVGPLDTGAWLGECDAWRKKYPLKYAKKGGLRAQHVLDRLDAITEGRAIITTDVGQHQMWAAQFCRTREGRRWITSGGAGTMGFGFPSAIGAQFGRPGEEVWTVVGDGGFQMTLCELATAFIHKLPVKVLIINNNFLGMVRQWQELFFENRYSGVDLEGNPDFVKLAEAYGVKGLRITRPGDVDKKIKQARAHRGPVVLVAEVVKEDNVFPMIPAGAPIANMIIEAPKERMEKPVGST